MADAKIERCAICYELDAESYANYYGCHCEECTMCANCFSNYGVNHPCLICRCPPPVQIPVVIAMDVDPIPTGRRRWTYWLPVVFNAVMCGVFFCATLEETVDGARWINLVCTGTYLWDTVSSTVDAIYGIWCFIHQKLPCVMNALIGARVAVFFSAPLLLFANSLTMWTILGVILSTTQGLIMLALFLCKCVDMVFCHRR